MKIQTFIHFDAYNSRILAQKFKVDILLIVVKIEFLDKKIKVWNSEMEFGT